MTRGRFLATVAMAGVAAASLGCDQGGRVRPLKAPVPVDGAWAFRSRPDLRPPAVTVARRAGKTAAGHVFVAPKNGPGETGPGGRGPMIVDEEGHPVWFRPLQDDEVDAMDFKAQHYRGRPVISWWEGRHTAYGQGEYIVLDDSYGEMFRVRAGDGFNGDLHEFLLTDRGTALITVYEPVPCDLSAVGGPADGIAAEGVVQEIAVETGEVVFQWRSLEHVGLWESYFPAPTDPTEPYDYIHINSVEVDHDGNLLVSARKTSAAYKLDRQTAKVVWRLDGKRSDFEMGEGTHTVYQHDARRRPDGTLTLFDNGEEGQSKPSRAVALDLDEGAMRVSLVREFLHPARPLSLTQGNMQTLPNDNAFVGWGSEPAFSEFSPDGALLFDARFPTGVESYRAFRFPWAARPEDWPAVAAEAGPGQGEISVHASWNGATEVAAWAVFAGPAPDRLDRLGSVSRTGFETPMAVRTDGPYVRVEALDHRGRALGRSRVIRPGFWSAPHPT